MFSLKLILYKKQNKTGRDLDSNWPQIEPTEDTNHGFYVNDRESSLLFWEEVCLTDLCTNRSFSEVTKNDFEPSNEQDMVANLNETVFHTRRRPRERIECRGDLAMTSFFYR